MRTLVATAEPRLDVSVLEHAGGAREMDVVTGQASLDAVLASGATYGAALVGCGSGKASLAPTFLGGIARLLQPGATVAVQLGGVAQYRDEAKSALVLSGFVDCRDSGDAAVAARTPSWGLGAKSVLKKKLAGAAVSAAAATPTPAAGAWKVDLGDAGDELVDEEELLTEEDRQRPAPAAAKDDCEVGASGRKACKNCMCGRAEAEAAGIKVQLTPEMIQNPGIGSSCGNCSLGDAFRCAGCPYRGLPAFEPGKPLTLPADFLVADA